MCDNYAQGYARKGAALAGLERFEEAEEAYRQGLEHDANNQQMKDALKEVEDRQCELVVGSNCPESLNPDCKLGILKGASMSAGVN